jgi:hypothetical protein
MSCRELSPSHLIRRKKIQTPSGKGFEEVHLGLEVFYMSRMLLPFCALFMLPFFSFAATPEIQLVRAEGEAYGVRLFRDSKNPTTPKKKHDEPQNKSIASVVAEKTPGISYGCISAPKVNIRPDASLNYPAVGVLSGGEQVLVFGVVGDWVEINWPERFSGWIEKRLARTQADDQVSGKALVKAIVNVRHTQLLAAGTPAAKAIAELREDDELTVVGEIGDWLKVKVPPDVKAYVHRKYVLTDIVPKVAQIVEKTPKSKITPASFPTPESVWIQAEPEVAEKIELQPVDDEPSDSPTIQFTALESELELQEMFGREPLVIDLTECVERENAIAAEIESIWNAEPVIPAPTALRISEKSRMGAYGLDGDGACTLNGVLEHDSGNVAGYRLRDFGGVAWRLTAEEAAGLEVYIGCRVEVTGRVVGNFSGVKIIETSNVKVLE